jgi:putative transposase
MSNDNLYSHNHIKGCWEYHLEWCPKYRKNALRKPTTRADCEEAILAAATAQGWELLELAVMPDHVHAIVRTHKPEDVSRLLFYLKGRSAYEMFRKHPNFRKLYRKGHFWSRGSFARSIGVDIETERRYVRNQADIHQRTLASFSQGSPHL